MSSNSTQVSENTTLELLETVGILSGVAVSLVVINISYGMFHLYIDSNHTENEKKILNVLYSHIAWIWQFDSLLNSFIIIAKKVVNIRNTAFLVSLNNIRTIQVNHMSSHYPIIAVFRLICHFNGELYMKIGEKINKKLFAFALMLYAVLLHLVAVSFCHFTVDSSDFSLSDLLFPVAFTHITDVDHWNKCVQNHMTVYWTLLLSSTFLLHGAVLVDIVGHKYPAFHPWNIIKRIVEALGITFTTPVEPFDDSDSIESDYTDIKFSTESISLLIQTIPAAASTMILEYSGVEFAGTWGSVTGMSVLTINGVYWLMTIPNLWNFSKEKWTQWFCFCQEELDLDYMEMLYANQKFSTSAKTEVNTEDRADYSNHI